MSLYTLIEQLGLQVYEDEGPEYVLADALEAILQKAPIRYGVENVRGEPKALKAYLSPEDTLQCRILLIEPIKPPDTVESLLKEGLSFYESDQSKPGITDWIKRARRVVGNP